MKTFSQRIVLAAACAALLAASLPAQAQTTVPIPITADEAFDAVVKQVDPASGAPQAVLFVDVRTRAEYHWVGAAAKVTSITLKNGKVLVPDLGKVKVELDGLLLKYRVNGRLRVSHVGLVASMAMAPLAVNVPYQLWDEAAWSMPKNTDFGAQMATLAGSGKPALILFCRSGGRTDAANAVAALDPTLFSAIYEIDQPDTTTNHGGFEGSSYGNVYNGYRGFPNRSTWSQDHPSVSWKDAGLPIVIGHKQPLP